jgi:hypothetical protein
MFLRFYHLLSLSPDPKALGTLLLALKRWESHKDVSTLTWSALCQAPQARLYLETQVLPALASQPLGQAFNLFEWPDEKLLQRILTTLETHPNKASDYQLWAQRIWANTWPLAPELAQLAVDVLPHQPLIEIGGQGQLLATAWQQQPLATQGWELWVYTEKEAALAQLYLMLIGLEQCRIKRVSPAWPTEAPQPTDLSIYLTVQVPPEADSLPEAVMAVPAKALLDPNPPWCFWRECLPHVQGVWFFPQSETALLSVKPGTRQDPLWLYLDPGTLPLELACADAQQHLQGGPHRHTLHWQQWVDGSWASETKLRSAG